MNRLSLLLIVGCVAGVAQAQAEEQEMTSRPDLCQADFAIQELEGVTWLAPTWIDDHFISCNWTPAIDFGARRPAQQPRRARCTDAMGEWYVDVVFERAPEGAVRLTAADDRLPRKTFGPCPDGRDRPAGGADRGMKPPVEDTATM